MAWSNDWALQVCISDIPFLPYTDQFDWYCMCSIVTIVPLKPLSTGIAKIPQSGASQVFALFVCL